MAIECSSLNRTYIYHPVQGSGNIIERAGEEEVYETPSAGPDMAVAIRNSQPADTACTGVCATPSNTWGGTHGTLPPPTREPLAVEGCCVKRAIVV